MKPTLLIIALTFAALVAAEPQLTQQESRLLEQFSHLQPAEAATLLQAKLTPDASPALLFAAGVSHWKAGNLTAARDAFLGAATKEPAFHRARLNAAKILMMLGDYSQAEEHLKRLTASSENLTSREIWEMLSACQIQSGNLAGAEASARQAIALAPDAAVPRELLLQALVPQKERLPEAIALARFILEGNPKHREMWALYSVLLERAGRLPEAVSALCCAREFEACTPDMMATLAERQISLGLFPQAVETIQQAQLPLARRLRLIALLQQHGAVDASRKLLESCDDSMPQIHELRANQAVLEKKPEAAIPHWEKVLAQDPLHPKALLALGEQYEKDSADKAASCYEKAALVPVARYQAMVRLANLKARHGDMSGAIRCAKEARAIKPSPELDAFLRHLQEVAP